MTERPAPRRAREATRRWPACGPGIEMVPDDGEGIRLAKKVCADCPVRAACLSAAASLGEPDGVWGGLTRDERYRRRSLMKDEGRDAVGVCVRCALLCVPAAAGLVVCDGCLTEPPSGGIEAHRPVIAAALDAGRSFAEIGEDLGVPARVVKAVCRRWSLRSHWSSRRPDGHVEPCGTAAARRRHERRGEPVCARCRAADGPGRRAATLPQHGRPPTRHRPREGVAAMIELVNLTGSPVVMFAEHTCGPCVPDAAVRVIAVDPLKPAARLRETAVAPVRLFGPAADPVPVRDVQYGPAVLDLPPPAVGVAYIVPLPVALAARRRQDLLVTGDPVRDAAGTVIGCRALARPL